MEDQWTNIYMIVAYHYYDLKNIAIRETRKFTHGQVDIDQDLFHTGLMNMVTCLSNSPITLRQAKGYWYTVYRNGLLRKGDYAEQKYRDDNEFKEGLYESRPQNLEGSVDTNTMLSDIEETFSDDFQLFMDYVEGYTLVELDEKYNIRNSDYRIRKIRKYVQEKYPELGVGRKKRTRTKKQA